MHPRWGYWLSKARCATRGAELRNYGLWGNCSGDQKAVHEQNCRHGLQREHAHN